MPSIFHQYKVPRVNTLQKDGDVLALWSTKPIGMELKLPKSYIYFNIQIFVWIISFTYALLFKKRQEQEYIYLKRKEEMILPSETSSKEHLRNPNIFQFGKVWNLPIMQAHTIMHMRFTKKNFSSKRSVIMNETSTKLICQHSIRDGKSPSRIRCIKAPFFYWSSFG